MEMADLQGFFATRGTVRPTSYHGRSARTTPQLDGENEPAEYGFAGRKFRTRRR
jgi:hypothetical protein